MTVKEFKCFLDLLMCSDPWPINWDGGVNERSLKELADKTAKEMGFDSWICAYHELKGEK